MSTRLSRQSIGSRIPFLSVVLSGGLGAFALAAPSGDFLSSFEDGESAKAHENRVEKDARNTPFQKNVTGMARNPLMERIARVTASAENAPNESADCAADGAPDSKWLAFQSTGWLEYELSQPAAAVGYSMTSGNDHPERDPKDWKVSGSDDGKLWTVLDTQTGQSWRSRERGVAKTFKLKSSRAYARYRLEISAIQSGGTLQLGGWDLQPAASGATSLSPMTTVVGSGPAAGYNLKPQVGFTGLKSLQYGGKHTAAGRGYAMNRLFDVNLPVEKTTRLSYNIFPELTANDLQYPSTYVAVNLRFSDGTQLSGLKPLDAYRTPATALGQGAGNILYPNQWNHVRVDVGSVAEGKTITGILLCYDNDRATEATAFKGWIDDIRIVARPARIDGSSLTHYVDTRRGTNSSGAFSRGSNEAITAVPNGFNFLVPVTDALARSREYSYHAGNDELNRTRFEGLGISHQPSPWMGDRNQFSVMAVAGGDTPPGNPHERAVTFRHDREIAQPDYYAVDLDNGLKAEMTPTNRAMLMRFTFTGAAGSVVLDAPTGDGEFNIDAATGAVTGWVDNTSGFRAGQSRMFISGTFDRKPESAGSAPGGRALTKYATFNTGSGKSVTLRLATSLISLEQAAKNLTMEAGSRGFDEIREEARKQWNDRLGVIRVEGASETDLVTLYSCLYRLNAYPNVHFENVGTPEKPDYQYASPVSRPVGRSTAERTGAKIVAGKMYVNNGFWDTYRTAWPAYALLYPEIAGELVDGFVQQYRDGGWIARWSSPGYADCMTGTSSDAAFADVYLRGAKLPDPLGTYDAAVKNASTPSDNRDVGRKGLSTSLFLGFTQASERESVSWATEGFINDFAIGNMAAALAEDPATPDARRATLREQAEYYLDRSKNYVNLFDSRIGYFQSRHADGRFAQEPESYDPTKWFGPYTETNGWNFGYHAPHDPAGLAALYGGRKGMEKKLDVFFSTPETSPGPIHEEVEARDARFGQWGVSNQVSHHVPFIYNAAGAPAKCQKIVREALRRSFSGSEIGQGYAGDEDNGEMSAWFIFNALGLYPLQVGSNQLVVGSPMFTKATVRLPGGKSLVINAPDNSVSNIYVQSLTVDGKPHTRTSIGSGIFLTGATLDYKLGERPSAWGTGPDDGPPSLTNDGQVAKPMADTTGRAKAEGSSGADPGAWFDNNSATGAELKGEAPTLTLTFGADKPKPLFYTLTAHSAPADPAGWTLEGSDNGSSWTVLDKRDANPFRHRRETVPFRIAKPGAFKMFRFTFRTGTGTVGLSEVELLAR
ncbi:MAG: GH92 family glycosyl hydrolase [Verrucomicrobia bacterium]|nr:GH92 family glycosyl hydrolase [Verrucomicrobiota bacterium]